MNDRRERRRETAAGKTPPPSPRSRRQALDPFFVFTYSLLALAIAIQFFLMAWMDLF